MDTQQRDKIVEAMAQAAWQASGEPESWEELPENIRKEWISYQDAALSELERIVPKVRRIFAR